MRQATVSLLVLLASSCLCEKTDNDDNKKKETLFQKKDKKKRVDSPHLPSKNNPPSFTESIFVREGFTSAMNPANHMPDWVAEHLTYETFHHSSSASRKDSCWTVDSEYVSNYELRQFDPRLVRYARGHLAPAAHHKETQELLDETHLIPLNVVPQEYTCNGCDWNRLENFTASLFDVDKNADVYVLSGPLFMDKQVSYLKDLPIPIPTHLFKVVHFNSKTYKFNATAAFVVPNKEIVELLSLAKFQVKLEELAKMSGLNLDSYQSKNNLCEAVINRPNFEPSIKLDCEQSLMTEYMHCVKLIVQIKHCTVGNTLPSLLMRAVDKKCFDGNVNSLRTELVRLVRDRATNSPRAVSLKTVEDIVDFLLPMNHKLATQNWKNFIHTRQVVHASLTADSKELTPN